MEEHKNIKQKQKDDDTKASPNVSTQPENQNTEPFKSAGWKVHNEITYRGVDWLLNAIIGVSVAYWSTRTASGKKYFSEPLSKLYKAILRPVLKNEAAVQEGSKWGSVITSIIVGGTAIIPPMMLLENKKVKKKIVREIDEIIYGEATVKNDPKFQTSYDAIDDEPHKSFSTGMIARMAVILPMVAMTMLPATNKIMLKYMYDPIGKATKWLAESLHIKPKKMLAEGTLEHLNGNPQNPKAFLSNWDFLHRTIGFDFGLTFIYAFAHEAIYKALAAKAAKKDCKDDVAIPAPSEIDPPLQEVKTEPFAKKFEKKSPQRIVPQELFADYVNKPAAEGRTIA